MTDNDVIKGLECCIKSECSKYPLKRSFCSENVAMEYALALINRQKAEIERLNSYKNLYEDLKAENLETIKAIKKCKAKAIREFAERLKEQLKEECSPRVYMYLGDLVDNLVKEMTEERK